MGLIGTMLAFGILFILFEMFQLYMNRRSYYSDFWNMFDLIRSCLTIAYCVLKFHYISEEDNDEARDYILALLTIFSWLRGISYLRLF